MNYLIKTIALTAIAATSSGFAGAAIPIPSVINGKVLPNFNLPPDLFVLVEPPSPILKATAMSQIAVRVINIGGTVNAPIKLTFTLPQGVTAPLKFSRLADHWLCLSAGQAINCTYDQALGIGKTTILRIPVTPGSIGNISGTFSANVAPVAGEINLTNNTFNMLPILPVMALALTGVVDPSGTYSQPVLDATSIPKYQLPLPNPNAAFFKHIPDTVTKPGTDTYTLDIKKVKAQILPPGFPATDVFAYGDPARPDTFSFPAHTIEARSTKPDNNLSLLGKHVNVQYLNTLNSTGHLLPVDHSIHGANHGEPDIRSVAHLHGAKIIDEINDGYPETWHAPTGENGVPMTSPLVYNSNPFDYTNNQEATLMWYHDHTMGITRLNAYAGLTGLYMLRDDNEMAMVAANQLPSGPHEIPLVLQDRMFHTDGSLAYPDVDVTGTGATPSIVPEFFGDVMVVNGVAWPYLQVEPRKYRFRLLNGSNARFYKLALSTGVVGDAPIPFQVIGSEGGFLNAPATVDTLTMGPAERYDIIVDFAALNGKNITLTNSAGTPFGGLNPAPVTPGLHDQLMLFKVNLPQSAAPVVTLPAALRVPIQPLVPTNGNAPAHRVLLAETTDNFGRILPILGTVADGIRGWMDPITEHPMKNTVETWEIFNTTVDAHPIHIHDGDFQVIERQPFSAILGASGELTHICYSLAPEVAGVCPPVTPATPALITERGWKETVIANPGTKGANPAPLPGDVITGEVTRINMQFEGPGQFVWHCHIMEHEDHDMMRPMIVHP
ncbi:MAG: multicopper oxidase domain-containing protein [Methylococcaceae bacterium]|nr:multicopper oxidase domain-containing protein [Methylococcaceae bacterium]